METREEMIGINSHQILQHLRIQMGMESRISQLQTQMEMDFTILIYGEDQMLQLKLIQIQMGMEFQTQTRTIIIQININQILIGMDMTMILMYSQGGMMNGLTQILMELEIIETQMMMEMDTAIWMKLKMKRIPLMPLVSLQMIKTKIFFLIFMKKSQELPQLIKIRMVTPTLMVWMPFH